MSLGTSQQAVFLGGSCYLPLAVSDSLVGDNVVWSSSESCLQVPLVFLLSFPSVVGCDPEG